MGPSKRGEVLVLVGKLGETLDNDGELGEDDVARGAKEDKVGVVGHVAGGGSEVDDGRGGRAVEAKDVNVGHHVVAALLLLEGSLLELSGVEGLQVLLS